MNKEQFLDEVRRAAEANGGTPPGSRLFYSQTATRESAWKGKAWNEWNNWNDVLEEAGFSRREPRSKIDPDLMLEQLALLTQKLGKFPITLEMRREKRKNPDFPNDKIFISTFGSKTEALPALIKFCSNDTRFTELLPLLQNTVIQGPFKKRNAESETQIDSNETQPANDGYVYLIRSADVCKIGCTRAPYRRAAEIANQSARGAELLHLISTDDPEGIEDYWHRRFASKAVQAVNKASGEWFHLSAADIKAFKQRKSM